MKRSIEADNQANPKKHKTSHPFTCNHLKIWFPKKDTHPLGGVINEMRLIRQKELYAARGEQLLLLTAFKVNEYRDQIYVVEFCKKNGIGLITTDYIKKELCDKVWEDGEIQQKLFEIAMMELQFGLVVLASDIFRTLSPVLALGAYSDIDEKIIANAEIGAIPELILNISIQILQDATKITTNNNFIYAKDPEHPLLIRHRQNIYEKYTNPDTIFRSNMFSEVSIFGEPLLIDEKNLEELKNLACAFQSIPYSIKNPILFREALKEKYPQHMDIYCYFYVLSCSGPTALRDTLLNKGKFDIDQLSSWSIDNTHLESGK